MSKIQVNHLQRKAVIYIRQSSVQQMENNSESQRRQYHLKERAIDLGWREKDCIVIDDDLGISGADSENRQGYQKLLAMIALREVGIIFGIEVSRLSRNCLDWYKLLEVASCFSCLIGDEDGIYDPLDFNDRLLLGLKGTISEAELYQIKVRMMRGRINKAKRGELELRLPIGYERDLEGNVVMSSDESVRTALSDLFGLFRQIRSIRGTLLYLKRRGLQFPFQMHMPKGVKKIEWRAPSYDSLYSIITNPTYAGVYIYGRRKRQKDPIQNKIITRTVPQQQWEVFIGDHHEGYISYEEYKNNQEILRNNSYKESMSKGAPREGEALLQGIVHCKKCGLKMRVRYTQRKPYYCCDRDHRRFGEPVCSWASAKRVDGAFEELFLSVLHSGTVDLSFKFALKQKQEMARLKNHWEQKLKRLQYEANLAQRRYESVDPENRLVASTLERQWNEKLEVLEDAKRNFERQFKSEQPLKLTISEIKQAINELPRRWYSSDICIQDKKEIVRTLVEQVFVDTQQKIIKVEVNWCGESMTELSVPKYIFTSAAIYHKIKELARQKTDKEIAEELNAESIKTVKGHDWTARRVMDFRLSNGIASSFTASEKLKIPNSGFITSRELAQTLKVNQTTIQKWFNAGILEGRKGEGQCRLWIKTNEEMIKKLDGTAPIDSTCVSFKRLMAERKRTMAEVVELAKNKGYEILRIRRGSKYCFYIQPTKIDK